MGNLFDGTPVQVNSFHNNVISETDLAPDFLVAAQSDDGLIEAARHSEAPWLGVMWHPERPGNGPAAGPTLVKDFFEDSVT
jgi:putative glutamine amidotransferase